MHYCPTCGDQLIKDSTRFICSNSHTHYINPKACVALVLSSRDGAIVFARRKHDPYKGSLDCIGGFLDVGDNFETAMYRELREESGLTMDDISDLLYIGSVYDDYPWEGGVVPVCSVYFKAKIISDSIPVAMDDVSGFEFFDPSDLPRQEFSWEGMKKVFELIEKD